MGKSKAPVETEEPCVLEYRVVRLETSADCTAKNNKEKIPHAETKPVFPSLAADSSLCPKREYKDCPKHKGEVYRSKLYDNNDYLNNIGEFLALVEGLKWAHSNHQDITVYYDSENAALPWVEKGSCGGQYRERVNIDKYREKYPDINNLIDEADKWLGEHKDWVKTKLDNNEVLHWGQKDRTDLEYKDKWGEIPADFDRKPKR
ncbi:hypothetical protein FACS189487_01320 [Campylobacterota bacterium]|nr:hypothetical protein FACS189487_01320 [Campylobacterota bacterium]